MTAGIQSDFQIYNDELQTGFNETLQQETEAFNAASNGAIVMRTMMHEGEYAREAFFKAVTGLVTRRDVTAAAITAITDLGLTQGEFITVKVNRKIGPIMNTRNMFRKIMRDPGEFSVLIGQQAAKATAIDMLNTGLRSAVAALSGVATLVHTVVAASPTDTISTDNLIQALFKAGDSANEIVLWAMHSTAYAKLMREQVTTHSFDAVAGAIIAQGSPITLNRPVLMTDSPALHAATSPTDPVKVLGLRSGAIRLDESELQDMVVDDVTGTEQLSVRVQGEYSFNVGILGFEWDIGNGGANPVDSALATASNWDQAATSIKSLAGVLMIADPV